MTNQTGPYSANRTPLDVCIIHSPVGGGHAAAAAALADTARTQGLRVAVLNAFDYIPRAFGEAYVGAHVAGQTYTPALYGRAFWRANRKDGVFESLRRGFDHAALAPLVKAVKALAPRVVLATHHLPLLALARARRLGNLSAVLAGVITDYGTHAVWAEAGTDFFAVAGEWAADELRAHAPHATIVVTGIPVRAEFEQVSDVHVKPGEPLRVLLTSGGLAVGPMLQIVASFADVPNIDLTVLCGRNDALRLRVEALAARTGIRATCLGYETMMWARMQDTHIVVGKAGGLTVTETLTAGRPMIVCGAVPGNEKLNEAFVLMAGAGIVAGAHEVGALAAFMRTQGRIEMHGRAARQSVPRAAAARILETAYAMHAGAHAA